MNEFIFTWSIENISYSWYKNHRHITSPSFVADTLQNTAWTLRLYPRGRLLFGGDVDDFMSLYLIRGEDDGPSDFLFNCEFSCISANNLTLESVRPERLASTSGLESIVFLRKHEVFVRRKALYLPQDTLTLRCRMWTCEGDIDQFGQCFARTRLEIERILSVKDMNPGITSMNEIHIHSKRQKELLFEVSIVYEEDVLKISVFLIKTKLVKFSTVKFSLELKNRILFNYFDSWLNIPCGVVLKKPFSDTEKLETARNKLKLIYEFIYSTGEETNSIEKISPCAFKFPQFPSKCILSFIPSGKLSDCPSAGKDLWDLYVKHILCDVELKTQSTSFWVHKTVLCARSPVFLAMFTGEMKEKTSKCVEIEDLENDTLEKFLAFLYTDNFEESQWNSVVELYYAADKYQVERLKCFCRSFFANNIDDLNVCELLMLADKHSDFHLKFRVEDYILRHHKRIFRSSAWKEFSDKQSLLAVRAMLYKYNVERRK
ncbi:Speckle-type POZ protein B [Araneus ventricosus]|uniref:Speckle-type POZ protein B n=1 Tax=Araneus ventricosus TaxID=182803 RepID=A0A4Y2MXS2_ARAVE|nr:Speckle-type POZ protein B [Araneus ventricosus]